MSAPRPSSQQGLGFKGATLIILLATLAGFAVIGPQPRLFADEGFHAPQIWRFYQGDATVGENAAMLPTYHAAMALLERTIGRHSDLLLRFLNLVGSLAIPVLMWRLVSRDQPFEAGMRTAQWYVMPLLFPFYFLVYTDAWALAAVLGMMLAATNGRFILAALAAVIATLLRQDMIVWVAMAWGLTVTRDVDFTAWRRVT